MSMIEDITGLRRSVITWMQVCSPCLKERLGASSSAIVYRPSYTASARDPRAGCQQGTRGDNSRLTLKREYHQGPPRKQDKIQ